MDNEHLHDVLLMHVCENVLGTSYDVRDLDCLLAGARTITPACTPEHDMYNVLGNLWLGVPVPLWKVTNDRLSAVLEQHGVR